MDPVSSAFQRKIKFAVLNCLILVAASTDVKIKGHFQCTKRPEKDCNGWNEWRETEYKLIDTQQLWNESHQLCVNDGAHLASIANEEENDFVHMLVSHCDYDWTYIGLNRIYTGGVWEWIDQTDVTYTHWGPSQPGGFGQNCAFISKSSGTWSGYYCKRQRKAVCERSLKRPLK